MIVDIGANYGEFFNVFDLILKKKINYISVEPSNDCYVCLKKSIPNQKHINSAIYNKKIADGKLDEVTDCIATGGGMDYVLKTVTPSLAAFQRLMEEMLSADLAIERYMTYIATRQVKRSQPNLAKLTAKSE